MICRSWSGQTLIRSDHPLGQTSHPAASQGAIDLPYQFFLMLPFVVTILAMALFSRRARAPAALLIPFRREER